MTNVKKPPVVFILNEWTLRVTGAVLVESRKTVGQRNPQDSNGALATFSQWRMGTFFSLTHQLTIRQGNNQLERYQKQ